MFKRISFNGLFAASALLLSAGARAQEQHLFGGSVCEEGQQQCVPDLTVRLIPPVRSQQPLRITVTDSEGRFRFLDVEDGKYLLEVWQDRFIVHRSEVDTRTSRTAEVTLTRQ